MNLSEVLRAHLELPHAILPGPINYAKAAGELRAFMTVTHLQPGIYVSYDSKTIVFKGAAPEPSLFLASND